MSKFDDNKKFLKRYRVYVRQIRRLEDKLYSVDDRIESTQSPSISGMPGGGIPRTLSDDLSEREELGQRINSLVKESESIKNEILKVIDHLDNPHQSDVLEMYFIRDVNLETIAEVLHYSTRQVNRLYSQGILSIVAQP